jgi:hypothetical protein
MPRLNRQKSLEEERSKRFSNNGAAQLFPSFNSNSNIFSNLPHNQSLSHIGLNKNATLNKLRWDQQVSNETRGFPTRHADEARKSRVDVKKEK